jgi:hypothetical protein
MGSGSSSFCSRLRDRFEADGSPQVCTRNKRVSSHVVVKMHNALHVVQSLKIL